jgi:hypothetical protein
VRSERTREDCQRTNVVDTELNAVSCPDRLSCSTNRLLNVLPALLHGRVSIIFSTKNRYDSIE